MTVDHEGELALYLQIAAILRAQIASGELQVGRPIPSEMTMAQQHGVSRLTVRKAVHLLRGEGLVRHAVGRGTFVQPPPQQPPAPES